ncbi:YHS domain-containing (seleno)protein [Phaeobacter gallaeciensis]|uniref:YHS domain-containing (seleno)protein n=1 Tax=Phaeobacter gallaeciensis TaxID=60890 RepID=UPI000BBCEA9C|nr:YHS domain-containing (seleno)protein [Phaeobacter gallaeciensis]
MTRRSAMPSQKYRPISTPRIPRVREGIVRRLAAFVRSTMAVLGVGSVVALAAVLTPETARADPALVSAPRGVAVGGHDVVAFFQDGTAVLGQQTHAILWHGAVWRFASSQNQERFELNPRAYAPRFGGYCAYALSKGYLAPGNPALWVIADGRLYLLNNPTALAAWQAERQALISAAEGRWPKILRK